MFCVHKFVLLNSPAITNMRVCFYIHIYSIFNLSGRDGKIHVFRLSDFECEDDHVRTKSELKEHRLERTKGCHIYAISRPGGSHLRMVSGEMKHLYSVWSVIVTIIHNG